MSRAATALLILAVTTATLIAEARAERRVALVIGNSAYSQTAPLPNPRNDAADVSAALRRLGFTVVEGVDLGKRDMERRIRDFSAALEGADVGLFFYAGHGLQVEGKNYLAPIDASLKSETDLDFEAVRLNLVLRQLERNAKLSLVFLDACRDNPMATTLARSLKQRSRSASIGRGLARVEKAVGMMIAFATQPGNIALDGDGRNSPFTKALLNNIETSGATIGDMMIEVRNDVISATDGKQVPWENSSLTGKFFFKPSAASPQQKQQVANTTRGQLDVPNTTFDHTFWTSIRDSNNPSLYEEYLKRFPDGVFSPIAQAKLRRMRSITVEEKPANAADTKTNEVKQALLQKNDGAGTSAAPAEAPAIDTEELKRQLAYDMQTALKRQRCYPGRVDGLWGPGSRAAVTRFNQVSRKRISKEPSSSGLGVIRAWKGRKCAVVARRRPATRSRSTTQTRRRSPPPSQNRSARTNQRQRPPPRREPPPSSGGSGGSGGSSGSIFIGRGGAGGLVIGGGIRF